MLKQHFNALKILSYNAIINFIVSNRNYGKTWGFKRRAFVRGIKKGKKTLWIRTFKKEVKQCVAKMFTSHDLQKFCGIIPYNSETKEGNFKQVGNTFYCKYNNKWIWFLEVACVSDSNSLRSADDVDLDTIIFDEFAQTIARQKRYRGNIVADFLDLFFSAKREHSVRCFLLGNKESVHNPFYSYFGIKALPLTFEGIKTYKKGSIALQQCNYVSEAQNEYDLKVNALLEGTSYGDYLTQGKYKNQPCLKTRKTPQDATIYIQLFFNNNEIKISVHNGFYYVNSRIDKKRPIYCDMKYNKYQNEYILVKRQKPLFIALINAIADNRVYYSDLESYEAIQTFYNWLGI